MLWLKENNIITKNIIEGNKEELQRLRNQLYDSKRYILSSAVGVMGRDQLNSLDIEEYVNFMLINAEVKNNSHLSVYVKQVYTNPTPVSLALAWVACGDREYGKSKFDIDLIKMFAGDLEAINLIDNLHKNISSVELMEIIRRCWPDFYYFIDKILKNINLKKIAEYDVSNLELFFEKYNVLDGHKAIDILSHVPIAANNNKVLTLARKITDNK